MSTFLSPRTVQSGLLIAAVLLACGAPAQEPPSKAQSRTRTEAPRREPETLKFANGLLRQRKYDLAAGEFVDFLATGPKGRDLADARYGLATARLYQGRYPESRQLFADFLAGAPDDPRALSARYRVGELSYVLADLPAARQALEVFTQAKVDHPALEMAWTYLGDACFGLADMPRARIAYERSISSYPKGRLADRARYGLGRTLAELGERDAAVKRLRGLARDGQPEWIDRAWMQIGLILQADGRFAQAADAFDQLERTTPASTLIPEAR